MTMKNRMSVWDRSNNLRFHEHRFRDPFSHTDSADDGALHTVGPGACFGGHLTLIVARTNASLFIFVTVSVLNEFVEKMRYESHRREANPT